MQSKIVCGHLISIVTGHDPVPDLYIAARTFWIIILLGGGHVVTLEVYITRAPCYTSRSFAAAFSNNPILSTTFTFFATPAASFPHIPQLCLQTPPYIITPHSSSQTLSMITSPISATPPESNYLTSIGIQGSVQFSLHNFHTVPNINSTNCLPEMWHSDCIPAMCITL